MSDNTEHHWGLYGGAGFIGQHLAYSILNRSPHSRVCVLDLQDPAEIRWKLPLQEFLGTGRLVVQKCDVRDVKDVQRAVSGFDVIVNLAAIHREPGHRPEEYFETNVEGAKNLCRLAADINCREVIFASSISVYGLHDRPVDEDSSLHPYTPYGQSKQQAEQIHQDWALRTGGRLSIIRPGVVFGAGEQGNVTRLVNEMLSRGRAIRLLPDQAKAGIYVEELLEVIHWLREQSLSTGGWHLVNGVSNEQITFNSYGQALQAMHDFKRTPLTVPATLLGTCISLMTPFSGLFPAGSKFHPQRLAKLLRANDVRPTALTRMAYPFAWPLQRALADWLDKGL